MTPQLNQVVGYVAPRTTPNGSSTIKKGIVTELFDDDEVRLNLTELDENGNPKKAGEVVDHHIAIAQFDPEKKRENSWHFLDEAAPVQPRPASAPAATPVRT